MDGDVCKKERLFTLSYILLCVASFLTSFSFFLLVPTLPFYLTEVFDVEPHLVGVVLSCYVVAVLCVRPFAGFVADLFPRKRVYIASYIMFALAFIGYLGIKSSLAIFVVLRVFHGFAFGSLTTAANTLVIDVMPSSRRGEGLGYYGVMNNDCSNLIIKDSHLHTVAAKKNTNIFNCTVDTIQIYENVSSIIEGCIIRCLTPCSSSNIIAVRNCLFKAEDDESSVNIAQIRSSSDVTLDINFYNCKIITPKSKSNVFVSTDYALRYALDSCELIIRNGKAIMPKGKNSQIVNCSVFLWNDEIEKSTRAIETVDGVENLEIINNVIYAGDIVQDYAKAGALIYLGGGNVQVINNILATKSAVGVTNGAPIRFKVSVATAYVIGNALPLYSMAYTINDGGVTTVKSANNILSGDLAT